MRKTIASFGLAGLLIMAFVVLSSSSEKDSMHRDIPQDLPQGHLPQIIQAVDIPSEANYCGEALPMDQFDVKERLDKELIANSYRHSGTILYLKKAPKYFPTIEKILAENNMPDDLKYLAVAESGLDNVTSPAGAKGYWQFMSGTGREYGLIINSEIDERFHLEKSTRAACKYLKKLKEEFGSWSYAALAYNMGGPRLKKNIASQKANTVYDLNVNAETMRYIFRIVAIKEIMKDPRKYGFYIHDFEKYEPFEDTYSVEVSEAVASWADFAEKYGISYRTLKVYNPWLIDSNLTNREKKTYFVSIPKK